MENISTDLIIIGGGPAGVAAGIYAAMDNIDYLLIEAKEPCWFMETSINSHNFVDGFTGASERMSGTLLKKSFLDHYLRLGGKFLKSEVLSLFKDDDCFVVETKNKRIRALSVIIASGTQPRLLKMESSEKFSENIHFDCVSDGSQYIGKTVIVVGGRNSGVVAACYLYDLGCRVVLIEIKDDLQAKQKYTKRLKEKNIIIHTSSVLKKMIGDEKLEKVVIESSGKTEEIKANGVFLYAGRVPFFDFLNSQVSVDEAGYVVVDTHNQTSIGGLFAAGDATAKVKQIITACGDGVNAYYFANKYIQKIKK